MKRVPIKDEDVIYGHYLVERKEDGQRLFLTIIDIDPIGVQNARTMDGKQYHGNIGDADVYELTKEERRAYFDMLRGDNAKTYPHYNGDGKMLEAGTLLVSDDGEIATILTCDIPLDGEVECSTMNPINLKTKKPQNDHGQVNFKICTDPKDVVRYWSAILENAKKNNKQ